MTKKTSEWDFSKIAQKICAIVGNFWTFLLAVLFCLFWLISGPIFNYSDTWQLIINTTTTVITFLVVFIIQNTQNRDTSILQLKLDELIKSTLRADDKSMLLDELTEEELNKILEKYKNKANKKKK